MIPFEGIYGVHAWMQLQGRSLNSDEACQSWTSLPEEGGKEVAIPPGLASLALDWLLRCSLWPVAGDWAMTGENAKHGKEQQSLHTRKGLQLTHCFQAQLHPQMGFQRLAMTWEPQARHHLAAWKYCGADRRPPIPMNSLHGYFLASEPG